MSPAKLKAILIARCLYQGSANKIAFEVGLDRHAPPSLADLNDSEIRKAIRRFSSFEEGLGVFDDLKKISSIDQL